MSIERNSKGRLQESKKDTGKEFIKDLKSLKTRISELPDQYPYEGQTFGSGTAQAEQQIPIICQNIDDAIHALRTGRDSQSNPITSNQIGDGLKRLVQATRMSGFAGLLSAVLSPDRGLKKLEKCMDELEEIADQLDISEEPDKQQSEMALEDKPDRKDWLDKCQKYKEEGQFEKAIECFDQIIQSAQDPNGWAHYLKGTSLMELCSYEEAVECFEAALKIDPEGDTYRLELGRALYELGRREEARAAFQPLAKHSNVYGLDKKARDWLDRLDLEEGKSEKKPTKDDNIARAMEMIPFVDPRTDTVHTALMHGANSGVKEAVDILLKAGANPKQKAPTGWTALLFAAREGHTDIVRALLQHGADPNDQNVFAAHTPLILSSMGNHEEVIKVLLEAGVDVNRKNQWGRTALSHAMPETEIWRMLVEAGAEE